MVPSAEILLDLEDLFNLPFGVGEKIEEVADLIPNARVNDDSEHFIPPLARPKVPARHYFVFGRPIETSRVKEHDRAACKKIFDEVQASVSAGIDYLLRARDHDPYASAPKRFLYE
ncbi:unnamed protein product, partial [Discosporangium mesarthrocarpum]